MNPNWTAITLEATYQLWRLQGEFQHISRQRFLRINGWV